MAILHEHEGVVWRSVIVSWCVTVSKWVGDEVSVTGCDWVCGVWLHAFVHACVKCREVCDSHISHSNTTAAPIAAAAATTTPLHHTPGERGNSSHANFEVCMTPIKQFDFKIHPGGCYRY